MSFPPSPHARLRLETFLSGMETSETKAIRRRVPDPLKPSLVEWKLRMQLQVVRLLTVLETFLSGMETTENTYYIVSQLVNLETFLSGMETTSKGEEKTMKITLKPSLVEWKHDFNLLFMILYITLKPSLVEWKLICLVNIIYFLQHLETFLSGMETYATITNKIFL